MSRSSSRTRQMLRGKSVSPEVGEKVASDHAVLCTVTGNIATLKKVYSKVMSRGPVQGYGPKHHGPEVQNPRCMIKCIKWRKCWREVGG